MKALSKSDKLRAFIAPKMIDLITLLENNRKSTVYKGGDIHGIYRYLDMIGAPTTLTTSGQRSHILSLCLPSPMSQRLSSHLLKLSARDRRLFVNYV